MHVVILQAHVACVHVCIDVYPLTRVAGDYPQNDLDAVNGSLSGGEKWVSAAGDHLTQ